ncbi:hypothetical protein AOQ84DRAFT_356540 [Glonium stellatum]|uniref:T6SS Phospholipase effector Tle1-like catalytic domain-containing protein n=1 Tax=Glonium stellatum TaxID=574774 RepID=A0A8E2ESR7_9PEZI|nr:hypothetical protein AOQ84DRAFT_356540 [Glonium stellatum]
MPSITRSSSHTEEFGSYSTGSDFHSFAKERYSQIPKIPEQKRIPNRLILCFDGTGDLFRGNTKDTNIVKLYHKFDRNSLHQLHYYQPGIGTYTADGSPISAGWFGRLKRSISKTIDQGFATTFDSHVMAGYRFLMRYYGPGDRIYIFGFSRGAFTARFLARMIANVGILSMGNEELVPFAFKIYHDYEMGGNRELRTYIKSFRNTFCRHEHAGNEAHSDDEAGIKAHFLGLFDTVSSVKTLEVPFAKAMEPPSIGSTAKYVRHAVAIDERRVKFKAALLAQDIKDVNADEEDIAEVWFPGNHGDVGGGWPAERSIKEQNENTSLWERCTKKLSRFFFTTDDRVPKKDMKGDLYQLSDIALKWMMDELDKLPDDQIEWNVHKDDFIKHYDEEQAVTARIHDTMRFGFGVSWLKVIFWNFMEYLPFIARWEYVIEGGERVWRHKMFPMNMGGRRDIPDEARFHRSILTRMKRFPGYRPTNQLYITRTDNPKRFRDLDDLNPNKPEEVESASLLPLKFKPLHKEGTEEETDEILVIDESGS